MEVDEEYESVFGITLRPTLYAPDDAEYLSLRQEILDAPNECINKHGLPFEGIKLCPHDSCCEDKNKLNSEKTNAILSIIDSLRNHLLKTQRNKMYEEQKRTMISSIMQSLIERTTKVHEDFLSSKMTKDESHEAFNKWKPTIHYFYIKRNTISTNICDAKGYYDPITQKFILKAGSLLPGKITSLYYYSQATPIRTLLLNIKYSNELQGYILRKDILFDAPSPAASVVLGRSANGWIEWKDLNNNTLDSIYRH